MYLAAKPEWKGDGVMHFYDGEVHIHEGIVDVDPKKETWIELLTIQGWAPLTSESEEEASEAAPVETEKPRSSTPPRRNKTNKA